MVLGILLPLGSPEEPGLTGENDASGFDVGAGASGAASISPVEPCQRPQDVIWIPDLQIQDRVCVCVRAVPLVTAILANYAKWSGLDHIGPSKI